MQAACSLQGRGRRCAVGRSLKTTKKKRKMRRAIDRRFDGTPSRRTRDYHLHDSFGYGGYGGDDY